LRKEKGSYARVEYRAANQRVTEDQEKIGTIESCYARGSRGISGGMQTAFKRVTNNLMHRRAAVESGIQEPTAGE